MRFLKCSLSSELLPVVERYCMPIGRVIQYTGHEFECRTENISMQFTI